MSKVRNDYAIRFLNSILTHSCGVQQSWSATRNALLGILAVDHIDNKGTDLSEHILGSLAPVVKAAQTGNAIDRKAAGSLLKTFKSAEPSKVGSGGKTPADWQGRVDRAVAIMEASGDTFIMTDRSDLTAEGRRFLNSQLPLDKGMRQELRVGALARLLGGK